MYNRTRFIFSISASLSLLCVLSAQAEDSPVVSKKFMVSGRIEEGDQILAPGDEVKFPVYTYSSNGSNYIFAPLLRITSDKEFAKNIPVGRLVEVRPNEKGEFSTRLDLSDTTRQKSLNVSGRFQKGSGNQIEEISIEQNASYRAVDPSTRSAHTHRFKVSGEAKAVTGECAEAMPTAQELVGLDLFTQALCTGDAKMKVVFQTEAGTSRTNSYAIRETKTQTPINLRLE